MSAEPTANPATAFDEYGRGPLVRLDHERRGITSPAAVRAELAAVEARKRGRFGYSLGPCAEPAAGPGRPPAAGPDLRTLLADLIAETVDQQLGPVREAWAKQDREIARLRADVAELEHAVADLLAAPAGSA